jgi:membrane protein implicated in regulation of membrane protease activity
MPTRLQIAALLAMMINAVLFGAGVVAVLTVPALNAHAALALPLVIILSFVLTPPIAWVLAPRLRARFWRQRETPHGAERRS